MKFRLAAPSEDAAVGRLITESFEPITWYREVDERFGALNGCDWRERWRMRLEEAFAREIVLVMEVDGEIAAAAAGTYDPRTALGFIDLLAVDSRRQRGGLGRAMLNAMCDHFRGLGALYVNLDCLANNEAGMKLYESEGWTSLAPSVKWFRKL
ncbi:MAG: GNAT family N-acetyltransferase [Bryobacteraceae bacterium]